MNIFVLNKDAILSAKDHCDKHVLKMIIESAQMLCTAHHVTGSTMKDLYRSTHINHPCSLWARNNVSNYKWLAKLAYELCKQYTGRYGKVHKSQELIERLSVCIPDLPLLPMSPFAQAMPDKFKNEDAVIAYRAYYKSDKSKFATWKTDTPTWW